VLLHDDTLWNVIDDWVTGLPADHFPAVLPLLRRTFATFASAERRQLGERVARGASRPAGIAAASDEFDEERANRVLPLVAQLLGLKMAGAP
jgi:hypothetical protein